MNIDLMVLLIWCSFGYWGYKIMERKNRDTALGVVLGALFGFIGIIICYCFKSKEE
jgi:branched-subunit amino acid transport protein AzlD